MSTSNSFSVAIFLVFLQRVLGDINHVLTSAYPAFINHQPPQSFQFFQTPTHFLPQTNIDAIYGPPGIETPIDSAYPKPEPAPVAPTTSTTTEFLLPEVVENRKAKDVGNFIPFRNYYSSQPPGPNYESPKLFYIPPYREEGPFTSSNNGNNGYSYEKPRSTTTTTTTTTNRPIVVPDLGDQYNGYNYQVPQKPLFSTPSPVYLPPVIAGNTNTEINPNLELRSKIQDMRCLRDHGGYFHAVLRVDNLLFNELPPLVDNDSLDKRCELKQSRGFLVIDIVEADFDLCGVKNCGKDLCLRLRFPIIRDIRTANDGIVTLHCKSQARVAAKTYALKMGVANDLQARSLGDYAHGGTQNAFRTHVELFRKSGNGNGFTHHLESSETVQLGEELLLRAHVLAGDGWNHTKLTDVSLQRLSPSGEILNVIYLINSNGCNNPDSQNICGQAPTFDPPLGHKLAFKAVMFQGMRSGEELVLSMRITGCLEAQDCQLFSRSQCGIDGSNLGRRKRNTSLTSQPSINGTNPENLAHEVSEISRISFRVAFEENQPNTDIQIKDFEAEAAHSIQLNYVLFETLAFVVLLLCLGIFLLLKFK